MDADPARIARAVFCDVSAIALRSDVRTEPGDYASDRCATLEDSQAAGARLAGVLMAAIEGRGDQVVSRDTTIDVSDLQPRK